MTRITLQNGKLVLRDGKVGTGQACCCGGCSGPCSALNPCPQGCACDTSGSTSATSVCYQNGIPNPAITSQASCEECATECDYIECTEYTYPGYVYVEEGQECPEGWTPDGWGGCYEPCPPGWTNLGGACSRTTYPTSCSECSGSCYTEGCTTTGNCGRWGEYTDGQCKGQAPCSCQVGATIEATITATFFDGASCAGQTVQGSTVLLFDGLDPFGRPVWSREFTIDGYGFTVSLSCLNDGYVTAANIRTPGVCLLGQGSGGWLGAGSGPHPVTSNVVSGVCRLSDGSWTATAQNSGWPGGPSFIDPNFGLEINWSLAFQYPQ